MKQNGQNMPVVTAEQDVRAFLKTHAAKLTGFAVRSYDSKQWLGTALLCIMSEEKLLACLGTDKGKLSMLHALRSAATTGLSLNPQEGKACLVPYGGEIIYQVMFAGMKQLAYESDKINWITVDYVCENDKFEMLKTSAGDTFEHVPDRKDRGALEGCYAYVQFKSGTGQLKYMTNAELEDHRKTIKFPSPAWKTHPIGMKCKTVGKRLCKDNIDLSPALNAAVNADDKHECRDITNEATMTPVEKKGVSPDDLNATLAEAEKTQKVEPFNDDRLVLYAEPPPPVVEDTTSKF